MAGSWVRALWRDRGSDYDLLFAMPFPDRALWRALSPLLDRALELEPGPRTALVESLRGEAPEVAAALERLLGEHDRVVDSGFLETPPVGEAPPSLAGQVIGPYTLVRLLGMGGMGTVWMAQRSDGRFEGHVALKLVNFAMLDQLGEERFRREGTLLSRLAHPSIARLLDAGVASSGQPYLVLELVDGSRIDLYADEQRLGVRARLELFIQVAEAVAHAHSNLVVHRDLKPSNILVDRQGQVKLLDFGIASLLDEASGQPAERTVTAARALTPEYAAPEQILGEAVTTATDVYALGVVLYQLLSGRHPTASGDTTPAGLLRTLAEVEPTRLSDAVAALRPDEPDAICRLAQRATTRDRLLRACRGDLDTVLARALKKRPAERYATATAFADDIRRHLNDQPVRARPDSAGYRARKFVVRHRLEVGAATSVALALLVGTALAVGQARTSARERDRALADLRRAEITNDFSAFLLSEATPAGKPVRKSELLRRGEEVIDRRFADDPPLRVHMLLTLSERYYENFQFAEWRASVERAFALSRPLHDLRLRALAGCTMAMASAEAGDHERANALLAEALADLAHEPGSAAEEARCRVAETVAANMTSDPVRGIPAGERAVQLERARGGPPGSELAALNALANAYTAGGRFAAADRTFGELMALFEAQGRERTNAAAICANNWAVSLQAAGQLARAVGMSEQAVALARELDTDKGAPPGALWTLGSALSAVGRHEPAVVAVEEAVAKARRAGSPLILFSALATASRVHLEAGRQEVAEERLRELQELARSQPNLPLRLRAAMGRFLAWAALRRGEAKEAVALARGALDQLEGAQRPPREVLPVLLVLASALNASGEFEAARAISERALEMARERLGEFAYSYDLGLANFELGSAQAGLHNASGARTSLHEAVTGLRQSLGESAPDTLRAIEGLTRLGGG